MRRFFTTKFLALIIFMLLFGVVTNVSMASDNGLDGQIIKEIAIEGNESIDTNVIRNAIFRTKVDEPFVTENVIDDMYSINSLGYFYDVQVRFETVSGGIKLIFGVIENPVISSISIKGAKVTPVHQFIPQMKVKVGEVFNGFAMSEDLESLVQWGQIEHGILLGVKDIYLDAEGVIEIEVFESRIGEVIITGNEKTQDFVIERELRVKPGDVFVYDELYSGLHRVFMLGFFDDVDFRFEEDYVEEEMTVVVEVKERRTGSLNFGAGYSSVDGILGMFEVADDNFLGRGQRLNASVELSKKRKTYEVGFYEPYVLEDGTSLGVSIYKKDDDISKPLKNIIDKDLTLTGSRNSIGGELTVGRVFSDYTRGRLTIKGENNTYTLDDNDDFIGYEDHWHQNYKKRTIGLGINTNTTDHPFNPTKGLKTDVSFEMGLGIFGGTARYSKLEMQHSRYFDIMDDGKFIFAIRGMAGRVLSGELQENELFRIGGDGTLRGYSRGGEGLVGDKMFVMNAEVRFDIIENIQGVVFADLGKAWGEGEAMNLLDLHNSYGVGVRVDTPLGLLRLDYGFGLNENNQRKGQLYFGIGQAF
ncbi:MAG: BamA/TamA family outer membrane protein [Firmicutes bacterium]|nr:BamA/TamA family outer membrane protein [Bacillota bacterium]